MSRSDSNHIYNAHIIMKSVDLIIFEGFQIRVIICMLKIGEELHDNICQILASTYMTLGVLSKSVKPEGIQLFHQCREYINLATNETRNLSHRLAPAFFNDSTLKEAFAVLLNNSNVEKKYSISLYFDKEFDKINLSRELQLNLYRILQEELRNIFKYAQCKNIEVDLILKNGKIKMRISDDGIGFDKTAVKGGIGFANMKRRMELNSGKFQVFSSPGNGCELEIDIPLKAENLREPKENGKIESIIFHPNSKEGIESLIGKKTLWGINQISGR